MSKFELPAFWDLGVAIVAGSTALTILTVTAIFVVLNMFLFKILPVFIGVVSFGVIFQFKDLTWVVHGLDKMNDDNRKWVNFICCGAFSYAWAVLYVGDSKESFPKMVFALFIAAAAAFWAATQSNSLDPRLSIAEVAHALLSQPAAHAEALALVLLAVGSFVVAVGWALAPKIEEFISQKGCSARQKVISNL